MQLQPIAAQPGLVPPPSVRRTLVDDDLNVIGVTKAYGRDEEIFAPGDSADMVYRVISGTVRLLRLLSDGRRQISEFYLPGDVFGVDLAPERTACAEAIGDVVVVMARRSAIAADPEQSGKLWRQALRDLERSQDHVLTLGRRAATERVACFLIDLAGRLGADQDVDLPMSRQDIADYLGLTIETVSRTMTQLQGRGLVRLTGCRHVRLCRPGALAELCD